MNTEKYGYMIYGIEQELHIT